MSSASGKQQSNRYDHAYAQEAVGQAYACAVFTLHWCLFCHALTGLNQAQKPAVLGVQVRPRLPVPNTQDMSAPSLPSCLCSQSECFPQQQASAYGELA